MKLPKKLNLVAIAVLVAMVFGLSWLGYRFWQYQELEPLRSGISQLKSGNYKEALIVIRPFARAGNRLAQEELGHMYALGLGTPRDRRKAAIWFRRAECGCFEPGSAEYRTALNYLKGSEGADQDEVLALEWLERAAEAGHPDAQRSLAAPIPSGLQGLSVNPEISSYWQSYLENDG